MRVLRGSYAGLRRVLCGSYAGLRRTLCASYAGLMRVLGAPCAGLMRTSRGPLGGSTEALGGSETDHAQAPYGSLVLCKLWNDSSEFPFFVMCK